MYFGLSSIFHQSVCLFINEYQNIHFEREIKWMAFKLTKGKFAWSYCTHRLCCVSLGKAIYVQGLQQDFILTIHFHLIGKCMLRDFQDQNNRSYNHERYSRWQNHGKKKQQLFAFRINQGKKCGSQEQIGSWGPIFCHSINRNIFQKFYRVCIWILLISLNLINIS